MNNIVNYFDTLRSSAPRYDVKMEDVASHIRTNEQLKTLTDAYRNAGSDEQRKSIKQTTGAILAAARVKEARRVKCITQMTGLSLCDIDHIAPERMAELSQLVQADPHTLLSYVTLSGCGLRIIFRYELDTSQSLDAQKRYYAKAYMCGNLYYSSLLGVSYDGACSDAVRLSALAHDPNVFYRPEAEPFTAKDVQHSLKSRDKVRRTELRVSRAYRRICIPRLKSAGVEFAPGSHNNYVMRVGYMMNDFGLPLETVQAWAAKEFGADYPQAAEVIGGCYAAQPEEFGKGSAQLAMFGNGGGKNDGQESLFASVEQIEEFLGNHIITRRNLLKDRLEMKRVGEKDAKFRYITESDVKTLWVKMSHETRVKLTDIYNVLESDYSTPYNPIREYLFDLPEWTPDKPDYLLELAQTVTVEGGDDEQKRFALYLKKWLVGMVAAWLDPDVVNHVVLVFIGEQGVYKSTWFNYLPPPALKRYYAIKFDSTNLNKDDLLLLSENIMVCLEEIDTMSDRVANFFKATITATSTNIRAAYGRYAEQRIHVASYCGTGNNPQFLNEAVSRRWLPFVVKHIVSPIDRPFNHEGIFSQALALYKSGFRYWFNTDEIKVLNTHNRHFQAPCLEEELIAMCFRKPGPEECGQFFPTSLVLTHIADNIGSKLSAVKVGMAMKNMGFESKRHRGLKGWICVPVSGQDMVDLRKRMAMHAEDDGGVPLE